MRDFETTYKTMETIYPRFSKSGLKPYMVGGISAAIQSNTPLYRQNEDIDLMVNKTELEQVLEILREAGYEVKDRRGNLTENRVEKDGKFVPLSHEIDCDTRDGSLLGIGVFVYERENGNVITNSYAYHESEGKVIGSRTVMPEELFDLMYGDEEVMYQGIPVRCQTKEFTYLSKSSGQRDKDKKDAAVIAESIGPDEQKRIDRIKLLQKRSERYRVEFDRESGEEINIQKYPSMEERIEVVIGKLLAGRQGTSKELKHLVLSNKDVQEYMEDNEDLRDIMQLWNESQEEGDLAAIARKIAHEYYFGEEQVVDAVEVSMSRLAKESLHGKVTASEIAAADKEETIDEEKKISTTKEEPKGY